MPLRPQAGEQGSELLPESLHAAGEGGVVLRAAQADRRLLGEERANGRTGFPGAGAHREDAQRATVNGDPLDVDDSEPVALEDT